MTTPQILSFAVIIAMMAAFIWGRFRYDVVAAVALLVAVGVGVVPFERAFSGFADDIVIIVGSALVVSAAVSRSGVMELALQRFAPNLSQPRLQLIVLVTAVAFLSAFVKNIGALAIMIPIAFQFARRANVSPSMFLMPMSFASLLGGLMTQIGTSPNIIVSRVREDLTGSSFTMFDFTPVGLTLTLAGIVFLALFYWLLPERRREGLAVAEVIEIKNYTTEATVGEGSPLVDKTVSHLQKLGGGRVMVTAIVGPDKKQRRIPFPDATLKLGDRLLMEGEPDALDKAIEQGGLTLGDRATGNGDTSTSIEAIIGPASALIGRTAREYALFERTGLNLLAVSRRDKRFSERLSHITLEAGDVVLMQGRTDAMGEQLRLLDLLPLAERSLKLGTVRNRSLPLAILAVAMLLTAFGIVPVAVAFFGAAVLMILTGALPLRELYTQIDGPILIMLAALIPVSDSLRATGATDLIASGLSSISAGLPPVAALALIMLAAMAVTPFLNNAATVLVMAPIAATFAGDLGLRPDAFLMAVAIGAGCDFLTPIGHQCNTLVMGPGGYRFSDYSRLGLPLSLLVLVVGVAALTIFWPLT
ncbi:MULTISPECIES: SLC13 family permease [unclassified Devosia]|jgi:di/tricarboxylate transporter|uniref:SLC13 family permease n=1 Tax=unclassified Devosia TaxID=196773 RepID=UPI0009272061|nr:MULTISPECIES: SLC13 family permease [unclassified Devosia]MBL8598863.1 SLC13 family permease [Devosia sp.]OJX51684.1 MAG: SLC13 family permease [Devosia sp. 66-22]